MQYGRNFYSGILVEAHATISKLLLLDYKGSIAWYDNKEQHYWCI
jgi:hypothetical protein